MGELQISLPFNLADAAMAGFCRDDVRALVAGGDVRRVVHGVYVSSEVPDSVTLRAAALKLIAPERTVICRRTAAWLHGVDVMALGAHLQAPPVEVMVPAETATVRRHGVVGYSGVLRDDEVDEIDGVLNSTTGCSGCGAIDTSYGWSKRSILRTTAQSRPRRAGSEFASWCTPSCRDQRCSSWCQSQAASSGSIWRTSR